MNRGRVQAAGRYALGLLVLGLSLAGCSKETPSSGGSSSVAQGGKPKIVFVFKVGGISYSDACKAGAEQANNDPKIDATVEYEAPDQASAGKQAEIIDQARVGGANAIVVSPDDAQAVVPALDKAADAGIQTFTWDSDAPTSKRKFYVAAVDDVQIGVDIADALAKAIGGKGKVLIFSGQRTAQNLNKHVEGMLEGFKKYPGITVAQPIYYNDDDKTKAVALAVQALQANPDAVGIACANSVSPPAAGEALRKLGRVGKVKVWGLALPSETRTYLKDGSVTGLYLWDPTKLTYYTAYLVRQALRGEMPKDGERLPGLAQPIQVNGPIVTLPLRITITKDNVDQFHF
ncbi:MAG TPA: autoinducer 2 ABC transporter substrate-binding protein [Chthonomonas sp.]|uniref:autoinducer 2 ABC transporter substrate-binding protein n=1 Tax=Chthonomonas sp. TaxID=2282153 RepID=UPI002B4B3B5B|nr:autoinducer 2 ABC transporter substrate-binding protein [Chthonomonas sp.]HLI49931.1 autoinducer 2 ABC transporter substrate-binding protein [Chthonomonas sp.]